MKDFVGLGNPNQRFSKGSGLSLSRSWLRLGSSLAQAWLKLGLSLAQVWLNLGSCLDQAWLKLGSSLAQTCVKLIIKTTKGFPNVFDNFVAESQFLYSNFGNLTGNQIDNYHKKPACLPQANGYQVRIYQTFGKSSIFKSF